MTESEREIDRRAGRARDIALFRYALIRQAADPALSSKQRGVLVRALAASEHPGPFGRPVRYSPESLDRWIRAWKAGGFEALQPTARHLEPRTEAAVLEPAAALKREVPARTAAQVAAVLAAHAGDATAVPSARTLQRHFARLELNTRRNGTAPRAFGRFEADAPNDRWTGDALHGPTVAGRKTYLFAFIDDHSRALVGYRWGHSEDTVRLEAALRAALAARGVPKVVYVDNGSAFVSSQLLRALASLGIQLTHSKPGQPAGRGKIERFFRTVRDQFLVELGISRPITDLAQLNELFAAWVETIYHRRQHSETGQAPLERFLAGFDSGAPARPSPQQLHEAFLWSARRTVTKTATISLPGNSYEVDAALVGRRVAVVFDPFDLTRLEVRYSGRPMGTAVPHRIGRHVHPDAHPETAPAPAPATGIDYLALVAAQHRQHVAQRINYHDLPVGDSSAERAADTVEAALEAELASFAALRDPHRDGELPGQLDLTDALTDALTDSEDRR